MNLIFVFIQEGLKELKDTFKCLNQTSIWRPRSKIAVVLKYYTNQQDIEEIFQYVWKIKILNLIIATNIDNRINILGFNPYFKNYFQNLTIKDAFYNKMVDLNGYVLKLLLVRDEDITKLPIVKIGNLTFYGGKDGNVIMSIIKLIRAKFKVTNLSELFGLDNPWRPMNRNRDLDYLKYKIIETTEADFFLDSQELFVQNFTENLYPHSRDDTVIILPKANIRSQYKQFLKIFNKGFSVIIISFTLVSPVIWYLLRLTETKITNFRDRNNIVLTFLDTLKLFLGKYNHHFTILKYLNSSNHFIILNFSGSEPNFDYQKCVVTYSEYE